MRKRLESVLLTLALLLSLAPALGGSARATAGNAETLYIAGSATQYANGTYRGSTALSTGNSVQYNSSAAKATFTRKEDVSELQFVSGYKTDGDAGWVEDGSLYGVKYAGNLIINVTAGPSVIKSTVTDKTNVYGIYVTGDLTIRGSKLTIEMSGNASGAAYGIYCGGTLTIESDVTVTAGTVTGRGGNTGDHKSCGIYAQNQYVQTDGTVTAAGGSDTAASGVNALETYGVLAVNGVTVSGGSLTATGGTIYASGSTHGGRSVGVCAGRLDTTTAQPELGTLTVSGAGTVVKATGGAVNAFSADGEYANNRSMSCGAAAETLVMQGGSLTAEGKDVTKPKDANDTTVPQYGGGESYGIRADSYRQEGGAVIAKGGSSDLNIYTKYCGSFGVFTNKYDVSGGTLTAESGYAWQESAGVIVHNELVSGTPAAVQSGGAVVSGTVKTSVYGEGAGRTPHSTGVWFGGDYSITGSGSSLSGTAENIGKKNWSTGVLFGGSVTLADGASVTGTGGDVTRLGSGGVSSSCGVRIDGAALTMGEGCALSGTGGSVTTAGGNSKYEVKSVGVWFANTGEVAVSGGALNGTGGTGAYGHGNENNFGSDDSYGILAAGAFTAENVAITARGGSVGAQSNATGAATIDGGRSYGVYVTGAASFSSCTVDAEGGDVIHCATARGSNVTTSYTVGLWCGGDTLTFSGENQMTLTGGSTEQENPYKIYFSSWGLKPMGSFRFEQGRMEAKGRTASMGTRSSVYASAARVSRNFDGSEAEFLSGNIPYYRFEAPYVYALLDAKLLRVTMSDPTYTGAPITAQPRVANAPEGEASYLFAGRNETVYAQSADAPTDAGDYRVHVSYADGHYGDADFTVKPKALTVTGLTAENKKYDGTAAATLTGTPVLVESDLAEGDRGRVSLSDAPVAAFADAEVGEDKAVTVTGLLAGERAFNYSAVFAPPLTASILPAVSVNGVLTDGALIGYTVTAAPEDARLIAARYDGGKLTDARIVEVSGDAEAELTLSGSGGEYRLMLVDGATFAPLCDAWENERK